MQLFFIQMKIVMQNPVFLAAITSWLLSQFIKTFIGFCGSSVHSLPVFFDLLVWRTGGMPKIPTAIVTPDTNAIGFKQGVSSDLFIFSIFSAMIVIRDAMGVRRSSGLQAKMLNEVGAKMAETMNVPFKPVKEVQGHTPVEVFAGMVLGVVIGSYFSLYYSV